VDLHFLSGDPAARGRRLGETCRGFLAAVVAAVPWEPRLEPILARMLVVMERETPQLLREMSGVAAGAGLPFEQVARWELRYAIRQVSRSLPADASAGGCANFVFCAADAGPLLGKTEDLEPEGALDETSSLQVVTPTEGYRFLLYGRPGEVAGDTGLNQAGLAVGTASGPLGPGQDGAGVASRGSSC